MAAGIEVRDGPRGKRYRASVWSPRDGTLIRKTFDSMAAAKTWRTDAAQALQRGTLRPPSSLTVREAAEAWLEEARAGMIRNRSGRRFKPATLRGYERALRLRVYPTLGALIRGHSPMPTISVGTQPTTSYLRWPSRTQQRVRLRWSWTERASTLRRVTRRPRRTGARKLCSTFWSFTAGRRTSSRTIQANTRASGCRDVQGSPPGPFPHTRRTSYGPTFPLLHTRTTARLNSSSQ